MGRCPMCLLFTLVTGNCDILECAPVLLVALQRQFLGSREKKTWKTCQSSGRRKKEKRKKQPFSLLVVRRNSGGGEIISTKEGEKKKESFSSAKSARWIGKKPALWKTIKRGNASWYHPPQHIHFMRQPPKGPPACQQRLQAKNEYDSKAWSNYNHSRFFAKEHLQAELSGCLLSS